MSTRSTLFGGRREYGYEEDYTRKSAAEYGQEITDFTDAMNTSWREGTSGQTYATPADESLTDGRPIMTLKKRAPRANIEARQARLGQIAAMLADEETMTNKGISRDNASALSQDIALMQADLVKDWGPTTPVGGTGLTPYDLEAPAKFLVPLHTPLRNSIPRIGGKGNARKFKRIDSVSNAGVPGGAGVLSPGFNSLTATSTWGPTGNVTLARPQKISYTGSDWSYSYVELGFSDSVNVVTQFEGLGFDDIRSLSHTALLYAHMMGEERMDLFGRGAVGGGYHGLVNPPTVAVAGSDSGGSLATNTYFVYVTSFTGFGESLPSTVQNSGARTGPNASAVITLSGIQAGDIGVHNLYVGTTTGIANAKFQGTFVGNSFTLTTFNAGGAVATGVDTSFGASNYDGYLAVQSDPTLSGYFAYQNAKFSTTNPGSEFDTALAAMYVNNGADPDEIWMDGVIRAEFGQLLRVGGSNGAASGYRTNIQTGDGSVVMGTTVTGYVNQNTSKVLSVLTHRFMPPGNALIRSTSVPIPNSHVTAPATKVNVQDYMVWDWPQIQLTYDQSTYQIGTLLHEAPKWSGLISAIL